MNNETFHRSISDNEFTGCKCQLMTEIALSHQLFD
eukprot:UN02887